MRKPAVVVGAVGIALAGVFGYYRIHVSQQEQVRLIREQIAQERADQQAQGEVAVLLEQVEALRKQLAPEPTPSWLAREVVRVAEESGLRVVTIGQDAPNAYQQLTHLSVNLQLTASYHQLGGFIDALERADHFIRVDRLTVNPSRNASGPDQASVRLVVSTYYLPPTAATGKSGRP